MLITYNKDIKKLIATETEKLVIIITFQHR